MGNRFLHCLLEEVVDGCANQHNFAMSLIMRIRSIHHFSFSLPSIHATDHACTVTGLGGGSRALANNLTEVNKRFAAITTIYRFAS